MTIASVPEDIFYVNEDDQEYLRMLREEEEFWDTRTETLLTKTPARSVQRYLNERLTGDPDKLWYQTIGDKGEYTNGCVFGAGPGEIEARLLDRHPSLHLTIFDISGDALSRVQKRLDEEYPGRAETRKQDLNFVELSAETYDLAVANASIHHLVNLEHFAFEVNRSLMPEGRFFMQDVVGESYFQFSEEKKRVYEMYLNATRHGTEPFVSVIWPDRDNWQYSPFESVRSGDILDVFERYLSPLIIRTGSALVSLSLMPRQENASGRLQRAIGRAKAKLLGSGMTIKQGIARGQMLFFLDSVMCDSGRLLPGQAFGIYGKRGG